MLNFPKAGNSQRTLSHGCLARLGSMRVRAIRSGQTCDRAHPRPYAALLLIMARDVEGRSVCVLSSVGACIEENVSVKHGTCSISCCLVVELDAPFIGVRWWTSKAFGAHRPMPRRTPPTCSSVVVTGCPLAPFVASSLGSCARRLYLTVKQGREANLMSRIVLRTYAWAPEAPCQCSKVRTAAEKTASPDDHAAAHGMLQYIRILRWNFVA